MSVIQSPASSMYRSMTTATTPQIRLVTVAVLGLTHYACEATLRLSGSFCYFYTEQMLVAMYAFPEISFVPLRAHAVTSGALVGDPVILTELLSRQETVVTSFLSALTYRPQCSLFGRTHTHPFPP